MEAVQMKDQEGNLIGRVVATRRQKTFVSGKNPTQKDMDAYEKKINDFLSKCVSVFDNNGDDTIILKEHSRYIVDGTVYTTFVYFQRKDEITKL